MKLRIAEDVCPWGEAAANLRTEALMCVVQAAGMNVDKDGAQRALERAQEIMERLSL